MPHSQILACIIDSNDFSVGGGSAASLTGGIAAALVAMVARLSTGKDFGLNQSKYLEIAEEADSLAQELLKGAGEDAKAYSLVKEAHSMPKATPEEQAARSGAIQIALTGAAMVPKENARRCRRVQELCDVLEGKSNPCAGSDLAVARFLAVAALMGCILNIEANINSIKDSGATSAIREEAVQLRKFAAK